MLTDIFLSMGEFQEMVQNGWMMAYSCEFHANMIHI